MGSSAFDNCSGLKSIKISASLTYIGVSTFKNCTALTDIYFDGTIEQWNAVEKEAGNWVEGHWNYGTPDYTVHCTDGDVTK